MNKSLLKLVCVLTQVRRGLPLIFFQSVWREFFVLNCGAAMSFGEEKRGKVVEKAGLKDFGDNDLLFNPENSNLFFFFFII